MNPLNRWSVGHDARSGRQEQGVTLLEMMIALCIGSWVIMAVVALYLSVTHAALFQQDLNNDQQGLQYLQQLFSSRLQQASAVSAHSTSGTLVLAHKGTLSDSGEVTDCTGEVHADRADWMESIVFDDTGRLTCRGTVLLDNIADVSILYGIDANHDGAIGESEYLKHDRIAAADWPDVEAVRLRFTFINHDHGKARINHLLYIALHQKIMARVNQSHD